MEELWKDISGYQGYYQVSSLGNIRSVDRVIFKSNGKTELRKGRLMSTCVKKCGYVYITLTKDKIATSHRTYRLVAEAFIDNPSGLSTVNHKDGNKLDNSVSNLEWSSLAANTSHAHKIGLSNKSGTRHHNCKLNIPDVLEIRRLYSSGTHDNNQLAKLYSVSRGHISDIVKFKRWKSI